MKRHLSEEASTSHKVAKQLKVEEGNSGSLGQHRKNHKHKRHSKTRKHSSETSSDSDDSSSSSVSSTTSISSSSSCASSSRSSDSSLKKTKRERKKKQKLKGKTKKIKREKRKKKHKASKEVKKDKRLLGKKFVKKRSKEPAFGPEVPKEIVEKSKNMAPMTKEEWEAKQSVVKKVFDEESGQYRLMRGDGEILEEIVSRDRHKEINRQATLSDGKFFQEHLGRKT